MSFAIKERIVIPLKSCARSLCWDGDELVDWVAGGTRFSLSGMETDSRIYFAYRFDRALVSPNRDFAVLYEALGTKGLIVRGQESAREINRSYYHATAYEYPIVLFRTPDGTQVLAHCPEDYNRIEIEELATGRRLTARKGEALDFFHSRLQVSPGGTYLLSAGWVWHPLDCIQIFRVTDALKDPQHLDRIHYLELLDQFFEIHAATFQNDDVLLLTGDSGDDANPKPHLAGYSLGERKTLFVTTLEALPGTMMPVGSHHMVGFYGHPKLFEISSGKVVQEWPELKSGLQNSSIIHHLGKVPPLALDPAHKRFAVAAEKEITVIQLA